MSILVFSGPRGRAAGATRPVKAGNVSRTKQGAGPVASVYFKGQKYKRKQESADSYTGRGSGERVEVGGSSGLGTLGTG